VSIPGTKRFSGNPSFLAGLLMIFLKLIQVGEGRIVVRLLVEVKLFFTE